MDHHATTPVDSRVLEQMLPYFVQRYGNAASVDHEYGTEAATAVDNARNQVASLINADPDEIIFTSGATESDNLAILGTALRHQGRPAHIVTCGTEHKAVLDTCNHLAADGWQVTYLPVDKHGMIDLHDLRTAITPKTALISLMAANNEVGVLHPLSEIGQIARERGVVFHTDATQALSYIPIDVDAMNIDLLSLSAHKIYGPKGIGALFVRRRTRRIRLSPILYGGGHERGIRSGTLNVPSIVGLGAAAELCRDLASEEASRLTGLRNSLWTQLRDSFAGVQLHGHARHRLPNNLNFALPGIESRSLIVATRQEVAMSTGAACTTTAVEPSHVLIAMGLPLEQIHCAIRIGLGRSTTSSDIRALVSALRYAVSRLTAMLTG